MNAHLKPNPAVLRSVSPWSADLHRRAGSGSIVSRLARGALIAALLGAVTCAQAALKVTPGGGQPDPSKNDGGSWEKALSADQLAERLGRVVFPTTPSGRETFWLKKGDYPSLWLHQDTKILGGFDGTEKTEAERDPANNRTTLAPATIAGYTVYANDDDPPKMEWPNRDTQIDGCTIFGGGNSVTLVLGGLNDFPLDAGVPVVSNCKISRNGGATAAVYLSAGIFQLVDCDIADSRDEGLRVGGPLSSLEVIRCQIHDNAAAGVWVSGGASIKMTDCSMTNNCTDTLHPEFHDTTGGLEISDSTFGPPFTNIAAEIRHCDISHNHSVGVYIVRSPRQASDHKVLLEDCTITDNQDTTSSTGGGVKIFADQRLAADDVTFLNCQITNNTVVAPPAGIADAGGGGFYIYGLSVRVQGCVITGNSSASRGGGLNLASGAQDPSAAVPMIRDCLIANNTAATGGGGVYMLTTQPHLINCTITGNHATAEGGGIYSYLNRELLPPPFIPSAQQRAGVIANCVIAGNTASLGTAMYHHFAGYNGDPAFAPRPPDILNCAYLAGDSWVRYWPQAQAPNTVLAPLALAPSDFGVVDTGFVNAAGGDYHLTAGSPLRDRGDDAQVEPGELDLDKNPRIDATVVDIGAYEFTAAAGTTAPVFTLHPASVGITAGNNASFSAAATGAPAPALHWQRLISGSAVWNDLIEGAPYSGTATGTLTVAAATITMNGDQFRCVAANGVGPPVPSNPATLTVANAAALVTITNTAQTYDGISKTVTVTTAPAGLSTLVTYDGSPVAPTNAGTYAVAVTVTQPGYAGSATASLTIAPSPVIVTVIGLEVPYTGVPQVATVTTVPAGVPVAITYDGSPTPPADAGNHAVFAKVTDPNYSGVGAGLLKIDPLAVNVILTDLTQSYDGTPKSATVTVVPAGATVEVKYSGSLTPPTLVGTYVVTALVTDPNHTGGATNFFTIQKGVALVQLTNLVQTFDGLPKPVTVTTVPAGLGTIVTYDGSALPPTAPGIYNVVATVLDANYNGLGAGPLTIAAAGGGNTPAGPAQTVTPPVLDGSGNPVANAPIVVLNFDQVTAAGNTTVTMTDSGPPPPTGFRLAEPPRYLDIKTTATFSGKVKVAVDYSTWTLSTAAADLRLSHFVGGAWVDITTGNDTADQVIYGETTSFSPFAVLRPATPLEQLGDLDRAVAALHANQPAIRTLQTLLLPVRALLKDKRPQDDLIAEVPLDLFVRIVQAARGRQIPTAEANDLIARGQALIAALRKERG